MKNNPKMSALEVMISMSPKKGSANGAHKMNGAGDMVCCPKCGHEFEAEGNEAEVPGSKADIQEDTAEGEMDD